MRPSLPFVLVALLGLAITPAWSAEVFKWTDENGVTHYSDAPPEGRRYDTLNVRGQATSTVDPAAAATPAPGADAAATAKSNAQSNCEIARKNAKTFAESQNVQMDRDGDGKPESLSEADKAKELARTEELIRIYCEQE